MTKSHGGKRNSQWIIRSEGTHLLPCVNWRARTRPKRMTTVLKVYPQQANPFLDITQFRQSLKVSSNFTSVNPSIKLESIIKAKCLPIQLCITDYYSMRESQSAKLSSDFTGGFDGSSSKGSIQICPSPIPSLGLVAYWHSRNSKGDR